MDRAAPLSSRQRRVLVQLVEGRPVLQDRSTSTAVQHKKNLAWDEIAKNFNAMHPDLEPRSVQQLKRSFNRIKLNLLSLVAPELNMGEDDFDTLAIQDGHPVDEAGTPIMDVTLNQRGARPTDETVSVSQGGVAAAARCLHGDLPSYP
ncbi:uncharacterized protein LOC126989457 [Eriocheir sinensis]|uniref:uncharacterized protein LOC126989457 n=1 Tax=Eriocheir sinensis TaxID=95602 RepID=UPI0021C6F12A|nr:uncharacterized protein LOC126989457 [Eriocheir sinensis]